LVVVVASDFQIKCLQKPSAPSRHSHSFVSGGFEILSLDGLH